MALGKILRETREQQGYTTAQVAEATHMMIQIVEELEREDFHRIAAPIYGRGFVKLYAEFLGIDPAPLIKEFSEIFSGARRPTIATRPLKPYTVSTDESSSSSTGSGFGVPDTEVRRNENAEEDNRETRENTRKEGDASIGARHAVCPGSGERGERGAANGREYARMDGAGGVGGSFETSVRSSEGKQTLAPPDGSAGSAGEPHNFRTSPAADPAVGDALDDLFAPRPVQPPVSRPPSPAARPPSPVPRSPSHGIAAEVLSGGETRRSRLAELRERIAAGLKTLLALLRDLPAAISANFPDRWRPAPVLAGAAAGLVVILVVVIVALRAPAPEAPEEGSGFRVQGSGALQEDSPAGVPPSGGSLSGASAPSPARPSSPLEGGQPSEPHTASALTIRTVLPPPEPYVD
ncbi:MAG: helix-turn-helix domain-containing protein [Lentisphaerae bacterium]|jgi:transcriptional regulator with XRE-family HTH domain|nr:helix-turn-helix domain-containing protein [Lentisphaerota bacterium]